MKIEQLHGNEKLLKLEKTDFLCSRTIPACATQSGREVGNKDIPLIRFPEMKCNILISVILINLFFVAKAQQLDTINLLPIEIKDNYNAIPKLIKKEILQSDLSAGAVRDVGDYLRSVPNVSGIRKGGVAIDPVIRGFRFNQLNVILDNGVKIENGCPNRMDPVASHVEAEEIQKIQIVKGPYVLRYGPSLGGLINIISETPKPYEHFSIHGNALYGFESNWNGQKEHISLKGGGKKVFFLFNAGQKLYQNYQSGENYGNKLVFNAAFRKYYYSGKLGIAISEKQRLNLSFNSVHGKDVLYPALPMDEQKDDTRFYAVDYTNAVNTGIWGGFSVKLYRSDVYHVMDNYKRPTAQTMKMLADVKVSNTGGSILSYLHIKNLRINIGSDLEYIEKQGERISEMNMLMSGQVFTTKKKFNLWNDARIMNAGFYSECSTHFKRLSLHYSLRMDFNKAYSSDTLLISKDGIEYFGNSRSLFLPVSTSFSASYEIGNHISADISLARAMRSPNMLERFIKLVAVGYDKFDYLGNPQLRPEINNQADISFEIRMEKIGKIYLNGFFSYVQDFISAHWLPSSIIKPNTQGVVGVKQFENASFALISGGEMSFQTSEDKKLSGGVSLAYTHGTIDQAIKYIVSQGQVVGAEVVKNDAIPEIPPMEANLGLLYKLLKNRLSIRGNWRIAADQKHTSVAFYEPYSPGFGIFSFSVSSELFKGFHIHSGINNIFDRAYYEHLNRNIVGSLNKLYEPGRVFYITLKYEF